MYGINYITASASPLVNGSSILLIKAELNYNVNYLISS